ncbi:hypothetical protein LTR02_006049 [Friedmanniomyces endolithicus]|nr:hypothetical protein LTR03_011098 [Friedmanniomyces endolithicus]KAK0847826.1 hypothetical protein LTS02_014323 [Friedmanniomyces endolithicus]KAK0864396.1 hypothetical protein LTR87_015806 [Friedmanniomyces endolithicus]KAK0906387.1 hypothetical protein LTR02_006049 [Friedmanniomyces endolithicus]
MGAKTIWPCFRGIIALRCVQEMTRMRRIIGLALCRHGSNMICGSQRNAAWPSIWSSRCEPRRWQSTVSGTTHAALTQPKKAMCRHCGRFIPNDHLESHIEQHHKPRMKGARMEQEKQKRQPVGRSQKETSRPRQPAKRGPQNAIRMTEFAQCSICRTNLEDKLLLLQHTREFHGRDQRPAPWEDRSSLAAPHHSVPEPALHEGSSVKPSDADGRITSLAQPTRSAALRKHDGDISWTDRKDRSVAPSHSDPGTDEKPSLRTVRLVAKSAATKGKVLKSPGDNASPGSLTSSKAPQKTRTSSVGYTSWTESQQHHLLQLLRSGHTCRDIADRIGRTFHAVQMFIHRHRLRYIVNEDSGLVDQDKPLHEHRWPLTWSEIEVNELSSMHAEGLSHATMASRLGRSLNSIENALKHFVVRQPSDRANRADRPRRRHRPARLWTPEELAKLAAWYTYGLRTAEIAALLDRPETSVRKVAARCGVKMRPYRKYELKQGDLQMMQELRLSGHTVREIASRLQIPYQKAWKTARRNPLPTPPATAAQPSLEKSSGKSDPP